MKKIAFLFICITLIISLPVPGNAAEFSGARVYVRVEGADRTIASGTADAYTFREALEVLAAVNELTLTFVQSGAESSLTNVTGAAFGDAPTIDGSKWLGFIIRGDQIVKQDNFLSLPLKNGDEVVLYQGALEETKIVTHMTCEPADGTLGFFIGVGYTDWVMENGAWTPQTSVSPVEGVALHVILPGGDNRTVRTDAEGRAEIKLTSAQPGMVSFYAEGYRENGLPFVVRTAERMITYGFDPGVTVTRAQAVAFIVNMYGIKKDRTDDTQQGEVPFSDIGPETAWFDEIMTAAGSGLVAGYEDKTFRPDIPINLMQLCVLTARVFPALADDGPVVEDLPEWAAQAAGGLYHAGCLEGIGIDWEQPVTPEIMARLYMQVTR